MRSRLIKKVVYFTLLVTAVLVMFLVSPSSKILADSNEVIPIESFESGTFNGGNFKPLSGVITNDTNKVVSGLYSAYLSSSLTQVWNDFANTDLTKVKFEKNTSYSVTFSYKAVDMQPSDSNRFFYFLARSSDDKEDISMTTWNDETGSKGIKTINFTTGSKENYYLIWGIHAGGALSLDDIRIVKTVPETSESFERGTYLNTNFLPGFGTITNDPSKVVTGIYSAHLSSLLTEDWKEFAYTDQSKYKFERNTTYSITFSYKSVSMDNTQSNRYFYFLARSTDNKEDKGWTAWNNQTGSKGSKTITFTTGNKENYYLIWGIHAGGALSIDDIQIVKSSESFEKGTYNGTDFLPGSGIITSDASQVISGKYSTYLKSSKLEDWKEFSYTDSSKVKFEKNTTYTVTFTYKSLDMSTDNNRFFYFLGRSTDNTEDKGWTIWNNSSGYKGSKTITFTTGNKENYYLIWGIHGGGAISLDDIQIVKDSESFERGTYNGTNYNSLCGILTNDPTKVVSGSYSANLASQLLVEWKDFIILDTNKVQFEKNTSYEVTFSYKSLNMQPTDINRYFYFLVRSTDGTEQLGWTTWNDVSGSVGTKNVKFTTGDKENYYIYWGIHGGGEFSLDDIIVKQLNTYQYDGNGRLIQIRTQNNRVIKYNYDSNGNLIKVVTE
ncbi:RHS repeat domain-containing protein [Paenibacillus sp. FSL R7-0048]|uniref:RHS repeat protein n=1 Tax=Paenibacillus TaxID=44249 RepID=UPI00096E7873|nr:RHS repeat domain-containing protein [Paenibacillus odorifer]OMD58214.1 hypothetical protein BSK48_30645 [Paenibacillus odorifer]